MKVFSPFLNGNITTSGSFNVPNHPSTASIQNPLTGSLFHDDTDGILKIYTGTQWQVVGEQATPAPYVNTDIEYLLVAGGGGAGMLAGGGGGAGGLLSSSLASVESGSSFTITIGGGGAGATVDGGNGIAGVNSSIAGTTITTLTSIGGGLGPHGTAGGSGGSGGGGGYFNASSIGGSGTVGQGNDGGAGGLGSDSTTYPCGGGGGAGTVGSDAVSQGLGGDGGDGKQSSITGTSTHYAGGGGGSGATTPGTGGLGGGGNGGQIFSGILAQSGTPNTGGGGGGGRTPAGSGGSGVAIFAYNSGAFNAVGGIVGDAGNGIKYNQFNSSGTFKVGSTSDFDIVTDSLQINLDAGNFTSRGNSTWTDLSGNANNASVINAVLDQDFYYSLDGNSDYFSVPYNSSFNSATFTTETWVKFDNFSRYHHLMCYFVEVAGQRVFYMRSYNNTAGLQLGVLNSSNVTQSLLSNTTNLSTGTWYHIVGTADGINLKIYVNGNLDSSAAQTVSVNTGATNRPMRIGNIEGYEGTYDLAGDIAQSRYYTKALTAAEVLQNYNATKTNFI